MLDQESVHSAGTRSSQISVGYVQSCMPACETHATRKSASRNETRLGGRAVSSRASGANGKSGATNPWRLWKLGDTLACDRPPWSRLTEQKRGPI